MKLIPVKILYANNLDDLIVHFKDLSNSDKVELV